MNEGKKKNRKEWEEEEGRVAMKRRRLHGSNPSTHLLSENSDPPTPRNEICIEVWSLVLQFEGLTHKLLRNHTGGRAPLRFVVPFVGLLPKSGNNP
jgi:hypothetical protein